MLTPMTEYAIAAAAYVTRIPESISSQIAAPLLCGALTLSLRQDTRAEYNIK
jgi:D-arabinose 1-dehydrogenase-like Zn-dependent alcohol dehydrogenase